MQTTWDCSPETESRRILHTAKQIATGFYRANGFSVLPYPTPPTPGTVILPSLPYLSIPRFWDRASRIDILNSILFSAPKDLVDQTTRLLQNTPLPKPDFQATQKLWAQHQSQILSEIYRLIPSKQGIISELVILPTLFGTGASFNLLKAKPGPIHIWLREDQGLSAITEAILTSLTRHDVYDHLHGLWAESELLVDWLLAYSPLAKLIPPTTPTIKHTRTLQKAAILKRSSQFLQVIGAPSISPTHIDISRFTSREKQIFDLLASRSPNIVTFDEIFNELSTNNYEQFSLYAISKNIQRLRDKLEKSGVSGSFIQTKRGEGYLLAS